MKQLSLTRIILNVWWPLATSWLLMGFERPIVCAFIARLDNPEINLASYAGIVFPLSLLIESPIIMLLATSTALCKDWAWYRFLKNFMAWVASFLTIIHMLLAFTSLYDFLVINIIKVPSQLVEPGRIGMMLMTPWTASIAIRRFLQGILIRHGKSRLVGIGTIIRLIALLSGLVLGSLTGKFSGIIVGTFSISLGVISEAIFVWFSTQPIIKNLRRISHLENTQPAFSTFLRFYLPLATTPLLTLLALPIASLALSRMPSPIESFAVWPILGGLVFLFQGIGLGFQEVVVTLIENQKYYFALRRFAFQLGLATGILLLLISITPLADFWLITLSGLSPALANWGKPALWFTIFLPTLTVFESWLQGILVHAHKTRGIIEAVVLYLITSTFILGLGIYFGQIAGIYVGYIAATCGLTIQTLWLRLRCQPLLHK